MRTKEQKIAAAVEWHINSHSHCLGPNAFKDTFERLLNGYFDDEPLPQITHPGKAWDAPKLEQVANAWRVEAYPSDAALFDTILFGRLALSKREAILAFNAGLER